MQITVDNDIVLRAPEESEADELFRVIEKNRLYLRVWLPWLDVERTSFDTLRFIRFVREQHQNNESLNTSIRYRGSLCGMIGFHKFDWGNRSSSIGYWLAEDYQGKGIMTRSCRALVEYAFNQQKFHRIEIRCATENLKSRAIPERLGFREEGLLRDGGWLYDHYVDLVVYGMLTSEWNGIQSRSS